MNEKTTFRELIEQISGRTDKNLNFTTDFIRELVGIVEAGLRSNGSVTIAGFGKFELRWMNERKGVNPQTGEEITIPAQNKVVFKPYKPLRDHVNRPYAQLEPQILEDKPETEESDKEKDSEKEESIPTPPPSVDESGKEPEDDEEKDLAEKTTEEKQKEEQEEIETTSDGDWQEEEKVEQESPFPFPFEMETEEEPNEEEVEDLLIERPSPVEAEAPEPIQEEPEELEKPVIDESKIAEQVQKEGSYRWSYAAAVILALIVIIALFYYLTPVEEATEELPAPPPITETEPVPEPEPEPQIDDPSPPGIQVVNLVIEQGQTLWAIARDYIGNAYLWPWVYYLNLDTLDNPNVITSGEDLNVPIPEDATELSDEHLIEVAAGYIAVYQWIRQEDPENARFFLWAAGSFHEETLEQASGQVDPEDLEFARRR